MLHCQRPAEIYFLDGGAAGSAVAQRSAMSALRRHAEGRAAPQEPSATATAEFVHAEQRAGGVSHQSAKGLRSVRGAGIAICAEGMEQGVGRPLQFENDTAAIVDIASSAVRSCAEHAAPPPIALATRRNARPARRGSA